MITHTLVFMVQRDQVLLGLHQRGVGKGKWNGLGGKVEGGEAVEAAMLREVREEAGLIPTVYTQVAELAFSMPFEGKRQEWAAAVYIVTGWTGEVRPSDEMVPRWFAVNNLPFKQMWEDDLLWLPRVLAGEHLNGQFKFDENGKMLEHEVKEGLF